jgi:RNA polymerase sigma-70 factor (ECF subfamily)
MRNAILIASRREPLQDQAGESSRRAGSFAAFVERHAAFVFRIAHAVTRHAQDAEDAAQETFLQVYRANRWEQIEDERAYLARVAWRLAIRQRKPKAREEELPFDLDMPDASPLDSAMDRQLESWLHSRIDALPEKLRQPLALAALGELKLVEIAVILGLPEGTVRRRIHTARARLRLEFQGLNERQGGAYEG